MLLHKKYLVLSRLLGYADIEERSPGFCSDNKRHRVISFNFLLHLKNIFHNYFHKHNLQSDTMETNVLFQSVSCSEASEELVLAPLSDILLASWEDVVNSYPFNVQVNLDITVKKENLIPGLKLKGASGA